MKISIISGSHRENSQSYKISKFIQTTLRDNQLCDDSWLLNLANNPIPLWEESIWDGDPAWLSRLTPISEQLSSSDGFVIVVPEWHGQAPAGLKNFFLMWGRGELAHKPALLVSVSSSTGGAYPIAELRMSSYKNNRICYIPEQLIIRDCERVLNENPEDNSKEEDSYYRDRSKFALTILCHYANALGDVRATGDTFNEAFKNGM